MPFNVLENKGFVSSIQAFDIFPSVFHIFIEEFANDEKALTTICVLYSHIMHKECELSTLQEYCNDCGVES